MAVLLLTIFLIVLIGLIVYGAYQLINKTNDIPKKVGDILATVHSESMTGKNKNITTNKISKTLLMEKFNLKPLQLKKHLKVLVNFKLINEGEDSVNITPFGVEFRKNIGGPNGKSTIKRR